MRVARPRGATLATATYHAHGSIPLTLKLKLTAAGGRYLVRHPRSTAKLTLRTTLGSRVATRSYSVRLLTT